jgi:hypothetical protein
MATRTAACTRADAQQRLRQAEALLLVARLVVDDDSDVAVPGVAAALAVLAGIAASDAACCAKLKERPRGQDHKEAVALLATVTPHGKSLAKDLARLLQRKDDAHYGLTHLPKGQSVKLVEYAERMVGNCRSILES